MQLVDFKRCIKWKADMLKNPSKATRFNYDTHDCTFHVQCILREGWLAIPEGYKVSLAGLFHHIYLPNVKQFLQLVGLVSDGVTLINFDPYFFLLTRDS